MVSSTPFSGKKASRLLPAGYNYIAMNDDVYVYTGITSVGEDQSNVGFILTNQRTKETKYYPCAGATEYSAMNSAEGVVQHLNYKATFPLLLNIHAEPTYFIALKDNAGLVKMYAMVNVQQYQIVATGSSVSECSSNYSKLLTQNISSRSQNPCRTTKSPVIFPISAARHQWQHSVLHPVGKQPGLLRRFRRG